jgi:2-polyprenyl-3-methyl-5-hydroxy-6-metoxy-1,4-benzoquinol methylase
MIDTNNPEINVDELMKLIKDEVAQLRNPSKVGSLIFDVEESTIAEHLSDLEALLKDTESKNYARTKLPKKLDRFPFNFSKKLQTLALKVLALLFRDQREINFKLIQSLQGSLELNEQLVVQISTLRKQMNEHLHVSYHHDLEKIRSELTQQKHLMSVLFEEIEKGVVDPNNTKKLGTFIEEQHLLDGFYAAFEDRFRGSYEDILNRLKVYLPLIGEAKVGTIEAPILDVGCGRGEWLDLLRQSGYTAKGLDINRTTLEQCRAKKFEVVESDVIMYLQSLPNESIGALTGFHIIEHLPFAVLIRLFDEAARVLKPNGLVIFETPNPQNVLVGSNTFYFDPTHRNPLPSAMIQFMAESRGLSGVRIMDLHPYPESCRVGGSDVAERFSDYFYGPQDYAVIGYKA